MYPVNLSCLSFLQEDFANGTFTLAGVPAQRLPSLVSHFHPPAIPAAAATLWVWSNITTFAFRRSSELPVIYLCNKKQKGVKLAQKQHREQFA